MGISNGPRKKCEGYFKVYLFRNSSSYLKTACINCFKFTTPLLYGYIAMPITSYLVWHLLRCIVKSIFDELLPVNFFHHEKCDVGPKAD